LSPFGGDVVGDDDLMTMMKLPIYCALKKQKPNLVYRTQNMN